MFTRASGSDSEKALAALHRAIAADPNDTRSLVRLGELAAKTGNPPLACEAYSRAGNVFLSREAGARSALAAFSSALQVARDGALPDRVARIARAVWKLNVKCGLTIDALATIDDTARWLIERGFDEDAVPLLEARIPIEDSEDTRLQLAGALARLKQSNRAVSELVTVFMRFQAQGRRDKALEVGERVLKIRLDVDIARACAKLYMTRNTPGDAHRAIAKLRVCYDAAPQHLPTLELLARAFELAGHPDKAERVREEMASFGGASKKRKSVRPPPRALREHTVTETSVIALSIADVELVGEGSTAELAPRLLEVPAPIDHMDGPPPNLFLRPGKKPEAATKRPRRRTT